MKIQKVLLSFFVQLSVLNSPLFAQEQIMMPEGATPELLNAFNQGSLALDSGRAADAVEKFKFVCNGLPNFGPAHSGYGAALAKVGRNKEAIVELEKAAALSPKDPLVLVNLGQTYQLSGRNADALETYKKYLSLFPNGQYAPQVSLLLKTLQIEVKRSGGLSSEGQPDYLNEAVGQGGGRWDRASFPLRIYIADGTGVEGYRANFAEILKDAFRAWSAAAGSGLPLQFVEKPEQAQIKCKWTADAKVLINPLEGGQALVAQSQQGKIMQAEILILTRNPKLPEFSDRYLKHVCLHEVGHALGLAGHSSQPGDVMFAAANYEAATGVMSERDRKTISKLYPGTASLK